MPFGKFLNGGAGNDTLTGTGLDDTIFGNGGDDKLNGGAGIDGLFGGQGNDILNGGLGADGMTGGDGDDTYFLDDADDVIVEAFNGGNDTVIINANAVESFGFTLSESLNLENLVLTGTRAAEIVGSSVANKLTGNAGKNFIEGLGGDDIIDGGAGADILRGGAGNDTYIIDKFDTVDEGTNTDSGDKIVASFEVSLANFVGIENLTITGSAIKATGNSANNFIEGNNAANIIDGAEGVDTMKGGLGNDTYFVDKTADTVIEDSKGGIDTVISSTLAYTLADNVENLVLKDGAAFGNGNAGKNVITGSDSDNFLDGKGGADTLIGGKGNDAYFVDDKLDIVTEKAGLLEGTEDTVLAQGIDYKLGANLENLTLFGGGNHNATGNAADNDITGDEGNNIIDGGLGNDVMEGGAGNDTYFVNSLQDVIKETGGGGSDTVVLDLNMFNKIVTGILIDLFKTEVENITLTGSRNFDLFGDDLDNGFIGNSGKNVLSGGNGDDYLDGKGGIDKLIGGSGSDTYVLDNKGDIVEEISKNPGDIDDIIASFDVSLLDYSGIENLEITGSAVKATGNASANLIYGNDKANIIDGGAGADTMLGGFGNDIYLVDDQDDFVIEGAARGIDLVKSSANFTLSSNIENLTLTGDKAVVGLGNELANIIIGNDLDNRLNGLAGADHMSGGKGVDLYVVDDAKDIVTELVNQGNHDKIVATIAGFTGKYTLAANVEDLEFTTTASGIVELVGNAADNSIRGQGGTSYRISGGTGNDVLIGGDQNDILDGGTGADLMVGGFAGDFYVIDSKLDAIIEGADQGIDSLTSSIDIDLNNVNYLHVENATLTGATAKLLTGTNEENVLTGNAAANIIDGKDGNDTLNGNAGNDSLAGGFGDDILNGGSGADKMTGNDGSDTYFVDNKGDVIVEAFNDGVDRVVTTVDFSLKDLLNVEDVLLQGSALKGTGNDLANTILGNNLNNTLDGGGGIDQLVGESGNDILIGGAGDDFLFGGLGNDTMTGGTGSDIFALTGGLQGRDVIKDFDRTTDFLDFLDLFDSDGDGDTDLADLLATVKSTVDHGLGKDVVITFNDGDQLTLAGVGTGTINSLDDLADPSHLITAV